MRKETLEVFLESSSKLHEAAAGGDDAAIRTARSMLPSTLERARDVRRAARRSPERRDEFDEGERGSSSVCARDDGRAGGNAFER